MSETQVLDDDAVRAALAQLDDWDGDGSEIRRTVHAPSFAAGIELVGRVAAAADELDHHPDIDIRYRDVTFRLSTHSAGGVTARDVELAGRIDAEARRSGG